MWFSSYSLMKLLQFHNWFHPGEKGQKLAFHVVLDYICRTNYVIYLQHFFLVT